jgi:hypothetical protein
MLTAYVQPYCIISVKAFVSRRMKRLARPQFTQSPREIIRSSHVSPLVVGGRPNRQVSFWGRSPPPVCVSARRSSHRRTRNGPPAKTEETSTGRPLGAYQHTQLTIGKMRRFDLDQSAPAWASSSPCKRSPPVAWTRSGPLSSEKMAYRMTMLRSLVPSPRQSTKRAFVGCHGHVDAHHALLLQAPARL